ncbi:hypothetical protein D3H65_19145 [Paraflavitalea soli]|uniref:Uncharacterized protein n=1 Tax=Paraflavitalea soli TaxID=2315862 RepID=A0A3B7MP83_9BACT|nr:hypothetical protein [Paraflavitalea soli]AXY75968.1 hypothetical protein D3H65_19145 [Paraflavitalea soli]
MSIVFGWNHFRIKSIDPYAAGLSQNAQPGYQIEVRQRYFHLFWIPCFSLGKKWALRKDNQLYEMPEPYMHVLRNRDDLRVKTPWYTYAGPLIAAFAGICYMISEKMDDYRSEQYNKKEFAAAYVDNAIKFRKPSLDDYYILKPVTSYGDRYARITGLDKNNIQLSYITTSVSAYTPGEIARLFLEPANTLATFTIGRGDSARLICNDYAKRNDFNGLEITGDRVKYRVEKIFRLDGPILKDGGFASYAANQIRMEVKNEGLNGTLTGIEKVEGKVEWLPVEAMPLSLPANKEFMLVGEGNYKEPYKVKLSFKSDEGRLIQFMLQGEGNEKSFVRIN